MAIARLSVGTGKKGKASPHAQYIAREGKYAKDNNSLEKLEHTGHGNMPAWADHNPNYFWQSADEHERKNGSTYREHVIALPRELDSDQRHELIKDWIAQEIGDKHAYQYAIHNPPAMDGKEQPHAHIMFSERTRDGIERDPDQYFKRYNGKNPDKGGAKKANTGMKPADRKADLLAQRDRWEQTCNTHLKRAGRYERISMKSLKEQGIDREPTNFTMTQLKNPEIKDTYKLLLEAKEQDYRARLDIISALEGTALTEINRQLRLKEQEKKAEQEKVQERTQKPIERQKAPQATNATPKVPKPKLEPNKADDIAKKRQLLQRFNRKTDEMAEQIHNYELKELIAKADPIYQEVEKLRENEPPFYKYFQVKEWQKTLDNKLEQHQEIMLEHDKMKDGGVTPEHKQKAYSVYYQKAPDTFEKIQSMSREVTAYDQQQAEMELQKKQEELAQRRQERQAERAVKGKDIELDR